MGAVAEADRRQRLGDPLLAPRQAVQSREELQVLGDREPAVQAGGFGHDRDALADLLGVSRIKREPGDHGGPRGRRDQRAEDPHGGGLARAVGARKPNTSPCATLNDTSATAVRVPKFLVRWLTSMAAGLVGAALGGRVGLEDGPDIALLPEDR